MRFAVLTALCLALTLGCDGDPVTDAGPPPTDAGAQDAGTDAGPEDAGVDAGRACDGPPGLYVDPDCTIVDPALEPFEPRFELWTDGAHKDRWIYLPPGMQIDTTNPDQWVFPVGTRVYKNFTVDGIRVETRLLEKTSAGVGVAAWTARTFLWNAAQNAVMDVTNAAPAVRENVLGTNHDIPDGATCLRCHIGQNGNDMVNGFSAFQLNHGEAGVTLTALNAGRLTAMIPLANAQVPGGADDVAALGYLHTNCGNCHREGGDPAAALRMFYMRLLVGQSATVEDTTTFRTGVNVPSSITFGAALCRFMPGDAANSVAIHRASTREPGVLMPPVGTEVVHEAGMTILRTWVNGLTVLPDAACTP
ncbi:MAG: hypothetical protein KF729_00175 [Sandaracinaceae bacterium]|nr:hypothetical protein [Sandaracinaceae bacterium]